MYCKVIAGLWISLVCFSASAMQQRMFPVTSDAPVTDWHAPMIAPKAKVTQIRLGTTIDPKSKVVIDPKSTFRSTDAIRLSVVTQAEGGDVQAIVRARWTYRELDYVVTVHDDSQGFVLSNSGATVFEISKPSPWPAGKYRVEVFLDNEYVDKFDFKVAGI